MRMEIFVLMSLYECNVNFEGYGLLAGLSGSIAPVDSVYE
jgi:hypothetical protein